MDQKPSDRRSAGMFIASMLIFGTIGVFRRYIPVSSAFLAFFRGILGGLCILLFLRLRRQPSGEKIPRRVLPVLSCSLFPVFIMVCRGPDELPPPRAE